MAEAKCPKCNTPMMEERCQDAGDWWVRWVCDCTPDDTWSRAEWIEVDIMLARWDDVARVTA